MKRSRKKFWVTVAEWAVGIAAVVFVGGIIVLNGVDKECYRVAEKERDGLEYEFKSGNYEVDVTSIIYNNTRVGASYCGNWEED